VLALPTLTASALDLSVFTSSNLVTTAAPAVILRPDLTSVGLPAAALLILTIATLFIQTRVNRRRVPASMLRAY
jgi:hypothetical protein